MASVPNATSNGFFQDLFVSSPTDAQNNRDHLDHIAAYVDTTQGAWDLFRVFENAVTWCQKLLSTTQTTSAVLDRVSGVVNTAGIGLSIPAIITDCNNLRRSLANVVAVQDLPYSDSERSKKITQAYKRGFLDTMSFINDTSQAALFTQRVNVISFEPGQLSVIDGVNNATSAILDGVELVGECFKLQHYNSPEAQTRNPADASKLEEKKTLSYIIIAKDVASIGVAAIALVGILFGVAIQSIALVATVGLFLSSVWLTMKIASNFYNKLVVEAPIN